ncbi:YIR007W [Symbiodinium pilosum]|uniref:YIR007W protein n=1 Tax=Symbiodinium pilosum TaxID=2952 RepID=A0A812J118_SYMPI|nr:YIR007W [Symbiodinium pilosum]
MESSGLKPHARRCHELTSRAPLGYGDARRITARSAWAEPLETLSGLPNSPSVPQGPGRPATSAGSANLRSWLLRRSRCLQRQELRNNPETSPTLPQACNVDLDQDFAIHQPFRWIPIQVRDLEDNYFQGVYVNSLSLRFQLGPGISWKRLDVDKSKCFCEAPVSCCSMESNIVLCKGLVRSQSQSRTYSGVIAQLPPDMCPSSAMTFTVLCREPGSELSLAAIVVTREGMIVGDLPPGHCVDLSGIRFATRGGFPLTDGIQLFSCRVGTQRFGMLQGRTSTKFFHVLEDRAIASIPPDFTPTQRIAFAAPGSRSKSFHLLHLEPSPAGGDLRWSDAVFHRDELEISGVIFEMLGDVQCLPSALVSNWSEARRQIVLMDFHKLLLSRYGSLNVAWEEAFDVADYGYVDFAQFSQGCRRVKYSGNVCRLWSMLDCQNEGTVSFEALLGRSMPRPATSRY